ncbi:MAG: hypothetical protein EPN73_06620 [Paraburkholderia sp.]|uniref:hypothetical protein n=1 Tax=Paraburkholderia sp. TaxID=1926495 RepID=UPI0011F45600|nr:hypothetical protein [Paraburkholderia sp.]TAL97417.1 MAG: hypothetical protein EPN73_06620 [Paraburkholderia sp.]
MNTNEYTRNQQDEVIELGVASVETLGGGGTLNESQNLIADLRQFLLSGVLCERQLVDAGALERFFDRELPPRDTSFMRLFELSMIENWLRHQS